MPKEEASVAMLAQTVSQESFRSRCLTLSPAAYCTNLQDVPKDVLDVWGCFCVFIVRSSILCGSGNCSGLPGDLVPGPMGVDSGPGEGGSEGGPVSHQTQ